MGVEKPASVGFDLHLVRVKDGKVAWTGKFDETQRPLSDNLLKIGSFFRRGARIVAAGVCADHPRATALRTVASMPRSTARVAPLTKEKAPEGAWS